MNESVSSGAVVLTVVAIPVFVGAAAVVRIERFRGRVPWRMAAALSFVVFGTVFFGLFESDSFGDPLNAKNVVANGWIFGVSMAIFQLLLVPFAMRRQRRIASPHAAAQRSFVRDAAREVAAAPNATVRLKSSAAEEDRAT
jgi:drug/metabolite transporter (DMT)-like permease